MLVYTNMICTSYGIFSKVLLYVILSASGLISKDYVVGNSKSLATVWKM